MQQLSFDELETWKPVPNYEGLYEVSHLGQVRSFRRCGTQGLLLKFSTDKSGHVTVELSAIPAGLGVKRKYVHQLVMEAFAGPPKPGQEVRHLDGNPANNRWASGSIEEEVRANGGNLFYGSHAENMQDMSRHGTSHWLKRPTCVNGHEWTPANTRRHYRADGSFKQRVCVACERDRTLRRKEARERERTDVL